MKNLICLAVLMLACLAQAEEFSLQLGRSDPYILMPENKGYVQFALTLLPIDMMIRNLNLNSGAKIKVICDTKGKRCKEVEENSQGNINFYRIWEQEGKLVIGTGRIRDDSPEAVERVRERVRNATVKIESDPEKFKKKK